MAENLAPTVEALEETFGWEDPFRDPAVGEFGLVNAVFAVGDTFVEIVSPRQPGTTAGRYLQHRGGDSGYMAIFQVPDVLEARTRVSGAGVRTVWTSDHPDIAGTHLHPKDVPGAIVSLDWAEPPESWRWAGPAWTGGAPPHPSGGIRGLAVEVKDPPEAARRWAMVLGVDAATAGGVAEVRLPAAGQVVRFHPAAGPCEGITEVRIATSALAGRSGPITVAGVRFVIEQWEAPQ